VAGKVTAGGAESTAERRQVCTLVYMTDVTRGLCTYIHSESKKQDTNMILIFGEVMGKRTCLQCFDAVGWAAGRASGL